MIDLQNTSMSPTLGALPSLLVPRIKIEVRMEIGVIKDAQIVVSSSSRFLDVDLDVSKSAPRL